MYRNPHWLFGTGCIVATIAVVVKALPIISKEVWPGVGKEGFDVAAAAVDPTLMALAGGLVGAAFVLKVQWNYERERDSLLEQLSSGEKNLEQELQRFPLNEDGRASWREVCAHRTSELLKIRKRLKQLSGGQINFEGRPYISSAERCQCRNSDRSSWSD